MESQSEKRGRRAEGGQLPKWDSCRKVRRGRAASARPAGEEPKGSHAGPRHGGQVSSRTPRDDSGWEGNKWARLRSAPIGTWHQLESLQYAGLKADATRRQSYEA